MALICYPLEYLSPALSYHSAHYMGLYHSASSTLEPLPLTSLFTQVTPSQPSRHSLTILPLLGNLPS